MTFTHAFAELCLLDVSVRAREHGGMLRNRRQALQSQHLTCAPVALSSRRRLRRHRADINALFASIGGDRSDTYGEELRSVSLRDVG